MVSFKPSASMALRDDRLMPSWWRQARDQLPVVSWVLAELVAPV
jgi:hypothetical protein